MQAFGERLHRFVRALVVPVVALAVIFAAPTGGFAAEAESRLIEAAQSGDTVRVERLLAGGADVDHQGKRGETALIVVSRMVMARSSKRCWPRVRK